jgi:glycosyltransferase involved in cell wall biosynthesis
MHAAASTISGRRLAVYVDGPYSLLGRGAKPRLAPDPADYPFLLFAYEVGAHFDSFTVLARIESTAEQADRWPLPGDVLVEPLPGYGSLGRPLAVVGTTYSSARAFWRALPRVDVVWVFGPHPLGMILIALALLRRKRVILGVRQDTVSYYRSRLTGRRWRVLAVGVRALDGVHRLLGRRLRTTVVGAPNHKRYGGPRSGVLEMTVSLVRERDAQIAMPARAWDSPVELLTVGRIDAEKNPLLLVDTLAQLEASDPGRYRLTWVGTGPLADAVGRRANELGVGDRLVLPGYIPFGPRLVDAYKSAQIFVHVSLTEGLPQVLVEALAFRLPIVATDVGGVRAALDDGRAGVLVPPSDQPALIGAIARLASDSELRDALVARGGEIAAELTLEEQSRRAASFILGRDAT